MLTNNLITLGVVQYSSPAIEGWLLNFRLCVVGSSRVLPSVAQVLKQAAHLGFDGSVR